MTTYQQIQPSGTTRTSRPAALTAGDAPDVRDDGERPARRSARALARHLLATSDDRAALIARVTLAGVMFPHGAQHVLGWFGGYGFSGTFGWMTGTLGLPGPLAALALATELVAPVALLLGVAGRLAAAGLFSLMIVAAKTHVANGFFMNWFGGMPAGAEGFEYHLLALGLAAVAMVRGSGAASLDRRISQRLSLPSFSLSNNGS